MPSSAARPPFEQNDFENLATSSPRRLAVFDAERHLCANHPTNHAIEILQLRPGTPSKLMRRCSSNNSELSEHLSEARNGAPKQTLTFVFMHQEYTWGKLQVSKEMIRELSKFYNLTPEFLYNLSYFRDRIHSTEEAFTGSVRSTTSNSHLGDFEINYIYKYPEFKEDKFAAPWRIRHTGICHKHDSSHSLFIVVSPYQDSRFEEYLKRCLDNSDVRSMLIANPMLVHTMLLSTYFEPWRQYLECQETALIAAEMRTECAAIDEPLVSFDTLKNMRAIEKSLLPLEPLLGSFEKLVFELAARNKDCAGVERGRGPAFKAVENALRSLDKDRSSYLEHARYLSRRAQVAAQSVSDTLSLHFQQLGQGQSENTFILAQSARNDSVAIKILTFVTSCYLPFSFVATVMGMNLVSFDEETHDLVLSNQLWLYPALSAPLMVITVGLCILGWWKHSRSSALRPKPQDVNEYELALV